CRGRQRPRSRPSPSRLDRVRAVSPPAPSPSPTKPFGLGPSAPAVRDRSFVPRASWPCVPLASGTQEKKSGGVPVQQFDMDILRAAQKGDPHPGSDRLGLDGKFGALFFELGDDPVDPVDTQADILDPELRRIRRGGTGLL